MGKTDKLGNFEQRVMAAIAALGEDAYGLAIYDKLSELEDEPNQGSMYVTLDRLERKGYLASRFTEPVPERGGSPRKYYRVKPEGARVLRESLNMSQRTIDAVPNSFWRLIKWPIKFPAKFK